MSASRPEWAKYSLSLANHKYDRWNIIDGGRVVVRDVSLDGTELFYRLIEEGATEQEAATMVRAAARAEQAIKREEQR